MKAFASRTFWLCLVALLAPTAAAVAGGQPTIQTYLMAWAPIVAACAAWWYANDRGGAERARAQAASQDAAPHA